MNGLVNKKLIMDAWVHLRKTNHTIPNETLDFMRDISIKKIEEIESKIEPIKEVCEWECTECGAKCKLVVDVDEHIPKYCAYTNDMASWVKIKE